jgi:competence protein ComEC
MTEDGVLRQRKYIIGFLVVTLFLVSAVVWSRIMTVKHAGVLRVAFLDVGQGDAVFIETPGGNQVLIDGGKGRAILRELGTVMPFYDRTIDLVIATHPDSDHIGGLPEVFTRYTIGMFIDSGVQGDGAYVESLSDSVQAEGLQAVHGRREMRIALDSEVLLQVLFPDRNVETVETNTGSLVVKVTYGETSFLLTGDSPSGIESYLVHLYGDTLKSDVLKLGHHGSRTSTSDEFLGTVAPEYAVISASCDNSYGHPHAEVLERLARFEVKRVSTCEKGTIVFESDGAHVSL